MSEPSQASPSRIIPATETTQISRAAGSIPANTQGSTGLSFPFPFPPSDDDRAEPRSSGSE